MVSSTSSSTSSLYIPGITGVLGSISATAAYAIISSPTGQTKAMQEVEDAPQVTQATTAFKTALSKMKTVNDLINNPTALKYIMTAFGLGANTSQLGIIKQVLTQDPTNSNSLVNQLAAPEWKTMATTLQTYATGLNTLKGTVAAQTFGVQSLSNDYLQVQSSTTTSYGSDGTSLTSTQNLYTNDLSNLTISTSGTLQTAEGYSVMGLKLDNNGNVQPPSGSTLVDSTTAITDDTGNQVNVKQAFSNQGNGNWQWTVTDNSGNILSQQTVALTFNPDGTVSTINGNPLTNSDGSSNSAETVSLNWADGGTTSQTFDFGQAFTAGFNQYQSDADLRTVQVNWFDSGNSPSTTITPYAALNGTQPVAATNNYTDVQSVNDDTGAAQAVTQTLNKNTDGTWNWTITNSDGTVLYNQSNLNLTFNSSGTLTAVNNNTNLSPSVNLAWADGNTTSQSFDLSSVFQQSDFSQSATVVDNIGTSHNVTLDYKKLDSSTNTWQVQVWDADTNTLASTVDFQFGSGGNVQSVGTYNAQTGQITNSSNNPYATSQNVSIDWGSGYGSSNLSLDLSNLTDLSSVNTQSGATQTGSVALGARQSVAIAQDGTVSATYANASGTGTTTIPLYRLAVNQFSDAAGLSQYGTSSYYTQSASSGTDTILPLGEDTDQSGNRVAGEAGDLPSKPTTTTAKDMMDTLTSDYDNYIYQQALGQENQALRYAVYFKQTAPTLTTVDALLGDGPSRDLVSTVFGIPQQIATQDLNNQEKIFSAAVNVKNFQNPTYVNQLIQRFLAVSDSNNTTSSTSSSPLSALLGSSDSVDAGSILGTVTSNINILA